MQSAEYLLEAPLHPRPHNVICYLCQQSAEKILKAKIVSISIKARYPNENSGQTKEQSSRACVLTKVAFEVLFNELKSEYELTDEEPTLELFEGAKNIRLPEHKPAYPKSIKREP